ncbi:MAG: response regulator [Anaerolineae bacterium]|nr:response regulator [Anaerolineae bacterium]
MIRLLLVEDELPHIELIRRAFDDSTLQIELIIANSTAQAKLILDPGAPSSPDLMITDWLLPDGQGIELLDHLGTPPCCPTIVMTSHGNEQVAVDAIKAGALDYVVKSVETLADMPHIAERAMREWQHIVERHRAEARVTHLNVVLNAIRSVNRLITRERDPQRLVEAACQSLVQTRGYTSAWIALFDDKCRPTIGQSIIVAEAGPHGHIPSIIQQRSKDHLFSHLPPCVQEILTYDQVQTRSTTTPSCQDCPLFDPQDDNGTLIGRLSYDQKTYGVISVSTPADWFADVEEQDLFKEMVDDIAFALYSIEQEHARQRFEAQFLQVQKMEAVGRLASGIAHDFNNHLTAITGYAELLLLQLEENNPCRDDVQEVLKAVERSTKLTRQLLIFSRKQTPQPTTVNLNTVIGDMQNMLQRLIGEDVTLDTILDPALKPIQADQGQIELVIMNLVINARDAISAGGKVMVLTRDVYLDPNEHWFAEGVDDVRLDSTNYVLLQVQDSGIGMSEEVQSHLFEPFFTTKEEGKGTGLGLATVYGIVNQSRGHIQADSVLGQGSTFSIYWPVANGPSVTAKPHRTGMALVAGAETILIIEDEDAVRTLAQRILQHSGYTVLQAANAHTALSLCTQYAGQIDLVITDVVIPGAMSGKELAERLLQQRPHLRTIFMSGYTDEALAAHGISRTDPNFIQKPFNPASLTRTVRDILDKT